MSPQTTSRGSALGHNRTTIKPQTEDGHGFARPFAVRGRSIAEVIAEFGDDSWEWRPQPGSEHRVAIKGRLSRSADWTVITSFSWWTPVDNRNFSITHRIEPLVELSGRSAAPGPDACCRQLQIPGETAHINTARDGSSWSGRRPATLSLQTKRQGLAWSVGTT